MTAHLLGLPGATGRTVVFVHGMEDGSETWRPLAELLDPSWRTVALDLPWRAGNDYRWRRGGSAGEWLHRQLAGLHGAPDVIVAHSFGASAMLDVLATDAAPAGAVVLVAPVVRPVELEIDWDVFERARAEFGEVIRDAMLVRLGRRADRIDEELRADMAAKMLARIGPRGFMALFEQFVSSAELELHDVRVPTLVLAGRRDPALAGAHAASLAKAMPDAVVEVIEHYDHFCHVEQAEDVARRLVEFVNAALPDGRDT